MITKKRKAKRMYEINKGCLLKGCRCQILPYFAGKKITWLCARHAPKFSFANTIRGTKK